MFDSRHIFFWGSSTSAHQVEGGNHNDWTEWERANAERLYKKAESERAARAQEDIYPFLLDPQNYISGTACDHYHRFREDFDIAQSLGHTAHRFSIEWSRIEPEKGIFNEKEIAHYREVIEALHERGIEPFVTLNHWTLPLWLSREGGWRARHAPEYFEQYVGKIVESYIHHDVRYWITLNEPEIYAINGYLRGVWPPAKRNLLTYLWVLEQLIKAHTRAYTIIKKAMPNAEVGIAKNNVYFEAVGRNPVNTILQFIADQWWNRQFLEYTKKHLDFIGLNYYFHNRIEKWYGKNENKIVSDLGWEIYPDGLYHVLKNLHRHYKKPIYITENGIADRRDVHRAEFIKEHVNAMKRAMSEGVDVRGYLHWSLLDNFEWDKGFAGRFGLVAVDYRTMERTVRPSALAFRDLIHENTQILIR